ncbi:unnamed protein product [Acanthoscelides obtectus]|uniref:Helitron helicase-like domain-containing protein n=1 Tax=Acanthoscelides obtectus TaxID=200917 RepID=A0A9P0PI08_ACAOB|nr:unnamed protein product [Acanthoscelides obtectus]CAK1680859.1 hypothetical protein AOBTE_LOCUS32912 [Acanthoscelides obtectus]
MPKKKRGNNWYAKKRIIKNPTTISTNDDEQDEPQIERIVESITVEEPQPGPSRATGKMNKGKTPLKKSKKPSEPLQSTLPVISQHLIQSNEEVFINEASRITTAFPNNLIAIPGPSRLSNAGMVQYICLHLIHILSNYEYYFRIENLWKKCVQGEIRHHISNISTNISNERRQYGTLYFLDTELANQLRSAGPQNRTELNRETVDIISNYMHSHNPFAQAYRFLKDVYQEQQHSNRQLTLELYINNNRVLDINFRQYGAVQANEIAAVFISEDGRPPLDRCLHVYCRDNDQIIHELPYLSVNCDEMTYPLLHPRGEPGWQSGTAHQCRRGKLTQQYIATIDA